MNEEAKKKFHIRLIELDIGTQAELARRLRVSSGMITHLVTGRRKTKSLQKRIARILDLDPKELWAEA